MRISIIAQNFQCICGIGDRKDGYFRHICVANKSTRIHFTWTELYSNEVCFQLQYFCLVCLRTAMIITVFSRTLNRRWRLHRAHNWLHSVVIVIQTTQFSTIRRNLIQPNRFVLFPTKWLFSLIFSLIVCIFHLNSCCFFFHF